MKAKNISCKIARMAIITSLICLFSIFSQDSTAQEITGSSGDYRTSLENNFDVQPGGALIFEKITGDVFVRTWTKNSVNIKEQLTMEVFTKTEAEEILKRVKNSYDQRNNRITVTGLDGRKWVKQRFDVMVPEKFDLDVQTSGGDISVENLSGEIDLSTSGGDIDLSKINGNTDVKTSGGDLDFRDIRGELRARTSGGDVDLQDIFGRADVSTSGGDVNVDNIDNSVKVSTSGGDLNIRKVSGNLTGNTSGGSIIVVDCSGDVDVSTSGGNIRAENIMGLFEGSTSGGDIDGRTLKARVHVTTSGGDIQLFDVQAPVSAATSGGDIEVEVTLQDFSQPHSLELRTSGGNIDLTIPEKLPASILAEIYLDRRGEFWKRYDIYSDFPLSKTQTEERGRPVLRSTGDINGGGDRIELQTSSGNIHINKR